MSKIRISELNVTELSTLNHSETSDVVGGNTQTATINSGNGNSSNNSGLAVLTAIGQDSTSTTAAGQTIDDSDTQVNIASILSRVGL